jgi:hypothetical protein
MSLAVLKIDVDGPRRLPMRELRRRARLARVTILGITDRRSPSGRGWHREIEICRCLGRRDCREGQRIWGTTTRRRPAPPVGGAKCGLVTHSNTTHVGRTFSALELVALQLLFGSDPLREACNLTRARLVDTRRVSAWWRARWNTFYDTSRGRRRI